MFKERINLYFFIHSGLHRIVKGMSFPESMTDYLFSILLSSNYMENYKLLPTPSKPSYVPQN